MEANPSASNLDCLRVNVVQGCTMLCTYGLLNLTLQHSSTLGICRQVPFAELHPIYSLVRPAAPHKSLRVPDKDRHTERTPTYLCSLFQAHALRKLDVSSFLGCWLLPSWLIWAVFLFRLMLADLWYTWLHAGFVRRRSSRAVAHYMEVCLQADGPAAEKLCEQA